MSHNVVDQNSSLFNSYLEVLKSRVFKILPLLEEKNEGVSKYIASLLFELSGLQHVVIDLEDNHLYLTLLATLEEIYSEITLDNYDASVLRSEILRSVGIVGKLQKGG